VLEQQCDVGPPAATPSLLDLLDKPMEEELRKLSVPKQEELEAMALLEARTAVILGDKAGRTERAEATAAAAAAAAERRTRFWIWTAERRMKQSGAWSDMTLAHWCWRRQCQEHLASIVHGGNVGGSDERVSNRGRAGGGIFVWSSKVELFAGSFSGSEDGRSGGAEHSPRQGAPKFEGMAGNGEASVNGIRADVTVEGKAGDTGRAFGGIGSDCRGDWLAQMVAKTKVTKFLTWKTKLRMVQQMLSASRVALQALVGTWPAKAANNSAELQRAE
jgi:hypothetical protein